MRSAKRRGSLLARLALASALGLASPAGASDCPDGASPPQEPLPAHARRLERLAERCGHDPGFLAWRGAVLLALGEPALAAELLERALLLDPARLGARLDYARALLALGDPAGALLLEELAGLADAPPAVREWLGRWKDARERGWAELRLELGADSNLNRAPRLTQLALSFPDRDLVAPLAPEARSRAGSYVLARGALGLRRGLASGAEVELVGSFHARASPGEADLALRQTEALALWRLRLAAGEATLLAGASELRFGGEALQRSLRVGSRRIWEGAGRCRPMAGLDLEARAHPGQPSLDHRYLQAQAAWICEGERPWFAQLAAGREFAPERPGGDAWRLGARGLLRFPLAGGLRLEAEARLAARRDDDSYSPLLERGARLSTLGALLRLELRRPLDARLDAVASLEIERQQASLALFRLDRRAFGVGLERRW